MTSGQPLKIVQRHMAHPVEKVSNSTQIEFFLYKLYLETLKFKVQHEILTKSKCRNILYKHNTYSVMLQLPKK